MSARLNNNPAISCKSELKFVYVFHRDLYRHSLPMPIFVIFTTTLVQIADIIGGGRRCRGCLCLQFVDIFLARKFVPRDLFLGSSWLIFSFCRENSTTYVFLESALHFVLGKSARRADADIVTLPMYRHADLANPIWRSAPIQITGCVFIGIKYHFSVYVFKYAVGFSLFLNHGQPTPSSA